MNPLILAQREIFHRWKSSLLVVAIVAAITGLLTFFTVNNIGFQKEVSRNARDIGSNVVILPATVDQFQYHAQNGYSAETMSADLVQQLVEFKPSLNHLIPMLERNADCQRGSKKLAARIVGLSSSIPIPGRPKAPMQKAIKPGVVQLGGALAIALDIQRDDETAEVVIRGQALPVERVNRSNGTWQDAAVLMDLKTMQTLFGLEQQISRIEAIECTSEQCQITGLKSETVLANELARITDQALILRREKMANARSSLRVVSRDNLKLLQNAMWSLLALAIVALSGMNIYQRKSEIGVMQALGYSTLRVLATFVLRAVLLTVLGAIVGGLLGGVVSSIQSRPLFIDTGQKFSVDWQSVAMIGAIATLLAGLASSLPALIAARRHPAEMIGRDG